MGVLDQIGQMRSQGLEDEDIVQKLQEQGIPPKAISDALGQEQIKRAVSDEYSPPPNAPYPGNVPQNPGVQEESQNYPQEQYQPQQEYYPQQGYENSYQQAGGMDTSTIIEISERVFAEKTQKMQKQLKEISDFKILAEGKLENLSERLKRIENMIDKMQIEILERVGGFGKNLETARKEMDMMQESFAKVVPSLVEKHQHHEHKEPHETHHASETKHHKKRK